MVYITLYKRNADKNEEYMGMLSGDEVKTAVSDVYGYPEKYIEKLIQITTGYKTSDIFVKNIYKTKKGVYKAII